MSWKTFTKDGLLKGFTVGQALPVIPKVTVSPIAGGPPASPVTGDMWIATAAGAGGEDWMFVYNGASASPYKWEFIGGPPVSYYNGATNVITSGATPTNSGYGTLFTLPRAGDYEISFSAHLTNPNWNVNYLEIYIGGVSCGGSGGRIMMAQNSGDTGRTLTFSRKFIIRGTLLGQAVQL